MNQDAAMSFVNVFENLSEFLFLFGGGDDLVHGDDVDEGGGVEVFDLLDGGHVLEEGDACEVLDAVGEADGEFVAEEAGDLE